MKNFNKKAVEHLEKYQKENFPNSKCGKWRGTEYSHILTESDGYKNFTFPVSPANISNKLLLLPNHSPIRLHDGWTHLNSSQVLCVSYFYPMINHPDKLNEIIKFVNSQTGFHIPETATGGEFELVKDDKTNVDFVINLDKEENGKKVYFEIKYTESEFGSANKTTEIYGIKVIDNDHYEKCQQKFHSAAHITFSDYKKNYQLVRNICLAQNGNYTIFLVPQANKSINMSYKNGIKKIRNKKDFSFAIIHWEDMLRNISDNEVQKKYFGFIK